YRWDPAQMQMDFQAVAWADALINLTGAGVADHRWTPEYKKVLYDSRINSTRLLQKALEELQDTENKQIVQASAIGYYANSDEWVDETSRNGDGFLAELCSDWETAGKRLGYSAASLAIVRIGIVLSRNGGFLDKMITPANWGLSAVLGNGKQHISWIHEEDLANLFVFLVENKLGGTYNAVSGQPVTNREMTKQIARQL